MHEVVEGIKLEMRTCKKCTNTFKVMPSHPQTYCSEFCEQLDKGRKPFGKSRDVKGRKRKKLKHTVQESDYE